MISTPSITSSTPQRGPRRSQANAWRRLCLAVCLLARLTAFAASAPDGHTIVNTVNVTYSNEAGTMQGHVSASANTTVSGAPALRIIRLDGTEPVFMGGPLTYTIEYQNVGTVPALDVTLTDVLSDYIVFVSASDNGHFAVTTRQGGGAVTWSLGTLAPGESGIRTVTTRVRTPADYPAGDPGTIFSGAIIPNTAILRSSSLAQALSTNIATTVSSGATLLISASADIATAAPGSIIHYTIRYENTGAGPASNAVVSAVIPALTSYMTGSADGTPAFDGTTLTWPVGTIPPGTSAELHFAVTVAANATHGQQISSNITIQEDKVPPVIAAPAVVTIFSNTSGLHGTVFDSVSGRPVANANVWLLKDNATLPVPGELPKLEDKAVLPDSTTLPGAITENPLRTNPHGEFTWPILNNGAYRLWVDTGTTGLRYASTNPNPKGKVTTGSRAEIFTLDRSQAVIDLPVDPPAGVLLMTKDVNKASASIGDIVEYRLTVSASGGPIRDVLVTDSMPKGLELIPKSSRFDGKPSDDPVISSGRRLTWTVGALDDGDKAEIRFRAIVGPTIKIGKATNRVFAQGNGSAGMIASVTATCDLQVNEGVFTSQSTLIGKVFHDQNLNGQQDKDEPGLPDITVYLENGRWAVSDSDGKFSLAQIPPGTHVLRADLSTLGPNAAVIKGNNRFMGSTNSQFVDVALPGTLYQADFPVSGLPEKPAQETSAAPAKIAQTTKPAPPAPAPLSLEEQIEDMTPDLAILSPNADTTLSTSHSNILIKAPIGVKLALKVNDQPVSEKRIGKTINNPKKRVMIVEFISVDLLPGAVNTISIDMLDGFGNVRGNKSIQVRCPGKTAKLRVEPESDTFSADGKSLLPIRITVLDKDGVTIPAQGSVTIDTNDGDIIDSDADKTQPGHQVTLQDGQARFSLRAPRVSSTVVITALFDAVKEEKKIFFPAHLNDLMLVGVAEMTFGQGSSSKNFLGPRNNSNDWLDDGLYTGGRSAFFAKGKITEKTLLTAAYDTHKPKKEDFFDENINDVDAEDNYPVLGDESRHGNDAQSRDKLYLRLDRGRSNLIYGDFDTDFSDTTLARYNRTFTGLKGNLETDRLKVTSFAANSDQIQVVDTIPGRGISGLYRLTHGTVVDGSERIVIETRERHRPSVIVKSESKARGTDYEMDYDDGTILFKTPIPSHDNDLNPIYIVVTYESESAAEENYTYGTRATFAATKDITLGLTAVVEENDTHDEALYGADMAVRLPANSVLKTEIAWSDSLIESNNRQIAQKDSAWLVEVESKPIDGLTVRPYYKDSGDDFKNDSATNTQGGRREAGADARYELDDQTAFTARVIDERDHVNDGFYQKASVGAEKKIRKTQLGLELSYENSNDGPIAVQPTRPFQSIDRSSFDISDETVEDSLAITLNAETQVWKNLSLIGSHRQELVYDDNNITQAGLRLSLRNNTSIYLKQEWADYPDRNESRMVFGVETDVAKNTVGYSEYRLANGQDGAGIQQCIGLRNTWRIADGLSGSLSAENATTTSGKERSNQPDAFAIAGSMEYLPNDLLKITSRSEFRDATDETSTLGELGLATKLHRDLAWLNRYRYFRDDFKDEGCRVTSRLLTGFAYRPAKHNRFNALTKFEYKHDTDDTNDFDTDMDSYIASLELVYQLTTSVQIAAKYAGKFIDDDLDSYTDLVATRINWDITSRFDAGIGYRVLNAHDANAISHGGFAELGYRVIKNLWVSLGYSFDAFDSDLTGENYDGKGVYVKLRLKFDEKTLDDIKDNAQKLLK